MKNAEKIARELEWAFMFHDAIRDLKWLGDTAIYPGRWAVNYSMLYLIVRILKEYRPERIIEFGLGESSKIISGFIENDLYNTTHIIVEESESWSANFTSRFHLSPNSKITNLPLERKKIKGFNVNCYSGLKDKVTEKYDLYVIDGPVSLRHYSRYDICYLAEKLSSSDQFMIVMDDYNRKGEKDTVKELLRIFKRNNISIYTGEYIGGKSQCLIATGKYYYATTL